MRLAPGLYDLPLTRELADLIESHRLRINASVEPLDPADSNHYLARHIAGLVRSILLTIPEDERLVRHAEICNELLATLQRATGGDSANGDSLVSPAQRLTAVFEPEAFRSQPPHEPVIPLSQLDLLVNGPHDPSINAVLQSEIESADRIDLLIAFIRWSGLRLFEERLRSFLQSGRKMRVITTTYTGSTERRAIERLVELGAEVRVNYQSDSTRLHAKSWLFHRHSGFSTAYIGSSNLSTAAMLNGLEWNVRLTEPEAPAIVEKFRATFDTYWADPAFELYEPETHRERFDLAVRAARSEPTSTITLFDLRPWPHQQEILDRLHVERYRHNRWKNLVVAATGTGKTVVAALDYRRMCDELGTPLKLLFVAHRREILEQSLGTFRQVMRDGSFGEAFFEGRRPAEGRQLFASVQTLANADLQSIPPDHFDVVIIDEFHHAAASTYTRLLQHFAPRILLGLTATPERTDGQPILQWFDGRFAVELRLWDALERELLSPFHYFGLHDSVDLQSVRWTRGQYDPAQLENLYTGNGARLNLILHALDDKVNDVRSMRALGFCAGVSHARYMAERFTAAGIPADAVISQTTSEERDLALRRLRDGEINAIFAVDIFNEGVDVPQIDTVLFLRPTESATVFLQQLGRGLRRSSGKECLTVLDFIGNAHRNFRFDLRFRALTGASRREVEEQIEQRFPLLPAGCAIQLDREVSRIVLENLRQAIGARFPGLVAELRSLGAETSLAIFLTEARLEVEDLYRVRGWSWTRLRREAFPPERIDRIAEGPALSATGGGGTDDEQRVLNALSRLIHLDDQQRIAFFSALLGGSEPPDVTAMDTLQLRMLEGLLLTLFHKAERDVSRAIARLWTQREVRDELRAILGVLEERAEHETPPLSDILPEPRWRDVPLALHAQYSLAEIASAVGRSTLARPMVPQGGVLWDKRIRADCFFITLEKSEKYYSPTTRYRDYAVSAEEFHWESQSDTRELSVPGQRYIHHRERGSEVFLFVRQTVKLAGNRTAPYTFLGPADYLHHTGERPMAILWKLRHPMPADIFKVARVVGG